MAFPEPSKELILQLLNNVFDHMSANPDDKNLLLELGSSTSEVRALHLEEIIKRRVAEKPESQLAPYNSAAGAVFLKTSIDAMKATDPDIQEAAKKYEAFSPAWASLKSKLEGQP
mmetsp:Transcript_26046/g.72824  ORF Transcript_26046/g.72824 Transcript_26046/m.72824 type:complete len:115 (+) Transcript_26046:70-414(+)|eukprot:CAMPEP_0117518990 /NCGR_PEP_ID=MMETSP0784-20121206/32419_1 /TAXON_ID=39447 /ORGANISM="" /LENGTH=114 /DNA_ID=CAMNT_0005314933 /DNA_START=51 /DNA_END=395 /DNA_ORIENTATION=+